MSFFGASRNQTTATAEVKDLEVVDPPDDSISCIAFCSTADILAVASWNNEVRLYDVGSNGETRPKAMYKHDGPVLDICWSKDGSRLFSAGADKAVRAFDMSTGQNNQVAAHDAPVSCVRWIEAPSGGVIATGSWDKTVKYWDTKSSTPVASLDLPERCYVMDVAYPLLVVGTAERHILIVNLTQPTTIFKQMTSPLKWQTRAIACFPAANGFAVGSIEGRVAIQYIEDKDVALNFSFKCHRKDPTPPSKDNTLVFAVNAICFHQEHGTFTTAGSDGTISSWDKDSKIRLKTFDNLGGPVVSTTYNHTGTIFAYAVAYDWSKGYTGMVSGMMNKVFLHACKDEEVKKRPKVNATTK